MLNTLQAPGNACDPHTMPSNFLMHRFACPCTLQAPGNAYDPSVPGLSFAFDYIGRNNPCEWVPQRSVGRTHCCCHHSSKMGGGEVVASAAGAAVRTGQCAAVRAGHCALVAAQALRAHPA